ncbi:hypothetical protein KCP78_04535 [Salmonella enterica subsp. enterica]|nr:hypothetical protein KCP78_04535 [Salmonella enterica subsp. enterica]
MTVQKPRKNGCTVCWKRCLKRLICGWSPNNVPPAKATYPISRKQRPEALFDDITQNATTRTCCC